MRVGHYFDQKAQGYYTPPRVGMAPLHRITASKLERELHGQVLSVGGLWSQAEPLPEGRGEVTVVDLSASMLASAPQKGQRSVRGDALRLPFRRASFDHAVMPLMLHHIAGTSGSQAQAGARAALREVFAALKPGGKLWVSEFCVSPFVYNVELLAAPLTRAALSLLQTPLVVMHSQAFYLDALRAAGFVDAHAEPIASPDARPTDWIAPIIGVSWLRVPRALYPVTATLLSARKPGQ